MSLSQYNNSTMEYDWSDDQWQTLDYTALV